MPDGAVVVGASSGVGRRVAEELARRKRPLLLAARDLRDLSVLAANLEIRHGVAAIPRVLDLGAEDLSPDELVEQAASALGGLEIAVITAGVVDQRDSPLAEPELIEHLVRVNYLGTIQLIAAFGRYFRRRAAGHIVVISSIAAAAPRGRNTVYSSAKAGLEVFCRGFRHGLHGSGVRIQVYALGYVDTRLAFGQKLLLPVAAPDRVARYIVERIGGAEGLRYYPRFWSPIVRLLGLVPSAVQHRLRY